MSHAVVIGPMLKGLAVAMHICMALPLIAPLDNYAKKKLGLRMLASAMQVFVKGKAR